MKRAKRKETIGNNRQYLTASRKRDEETVDERDLVSSLPVDLITEIFAKLPPKSIAKLISVSKLWSSIVRGKYLTELFLSRSLTPPNFLFTRGIPNIRIFYTRSQDEPSSDNRTTSTIPNRIDYFSTPVRCLICGEELENSVSKVICNPSTGQFVTLPRFKTIRRRQPYDIIKHLLGYDPINDVYKVLGMTIPYDSGTHVSEEHQVFTLGAKKKAWRMIKCKHPHWPVTRELCRDGVVYYGAWYNSQEEGSLIVSFDVRSENFGVIKLPDDVKIRPSRYTELVNYYGKITLVKRSTSGVDMCVLENVKKQEWSKISILLPDIVWTWGRIFFCKGTISTGEIIFAPSNPSFLVYYDPKGHNAKRVDIEGVRDSGDNGLTTVFLDHVESPMFLQKEV